MHNINSEYTYENPFDLIECVSTKFQEIEFTRNNLFIENDHPNISQWIINLKNNSQWYSLFLNVIDVQFTIDCPHMVKLENKLPQQYFLVPVKNSKIIESLLINNIYAFSITPLREIEFTTYIKNFFTIEYQTKLFKTLEFPKLDLTTKENKILSSLLEKNNQGLSRTDLMKIGWSNTTVYHKTLDVHLFNLRRKLEEINVEIIFDKNIWKINLEKFKLSHSKPIAPLNSSFCSELINI